MASVAAISEWGPWDQREKDMPMFLTAGLSKCVHKSFSNFQYGLICRDEGEGEYARGYLALRHCTISGGPPAPSTRRT